METHTLWHYRAKPVRVIDGDTLILLVDTGFGSRHEATIRLAGIDAPELISEEGKRAKEALIEMIDSSAEWGLRVTTKKLRTGTDAMSFARYLGDVQVVADSGDGFDVAEAMVEAGHARRYR